MEVIITVLSLIVAGISGIASIVWSNQYKEAKQAQLDAKDDIIEGLKELSSQKMRESYLSMREMIEEHNEALKQQIVELQTNSKRLEGELKKSQGIIKKLDEKISKYKIEDSDKAKTLSWLNDITTSISNSQTYQVESKQLQDRMNSEIISWAEFKSREPLFLRGNDPDSEWLLNKYLTVKPKGDKDKSDNLDN